MWKFFCDNCGQTLNEDTLRTIEEHDKEVSLIVKNNELDVGLLPRYIVFKCPVCDFISKMDVDKLLNPYLELILSRLDKYRIQECMYTIKNNNWFVKNFSEDNGIAFCGCCSGFLDGDGYCYNDVIKVCPVRRVIVEK